MRLVKACMRAKSLQSCPILCDPIVAHQASLSIGFSRQEYWSGLPCPPPGDHFPTQGSNPVLSHCRQILYCPSHEGSPRILAWVAYPFSRGTSQPRNRTGVSCIADRFFTSWATWEAHFYLYVTDIWAWDSGKMITCPGPYSYKGVEVRFKHRSVWCKSEF